MTNFTEGTAHLEPAAPSPRGVSTLAHQPFRDEVPAPWVIYLSPCGRGNGKARGYSLLGISLTIRSVYSASFVSSTVLFAFSSRSFRKFCENREHSDTWHQGHAACFPVTCCDTNVCGGPGKGLSGQNCARSRGGDRVVSPAFRQCLCPRCSPCAEFP